MSNPTRPEVSMDFTVTPDAIAVAGRDAAVDIAIHDASHQLLQATGHPGPYDCTWEDADEDGAIRGKVTVPAS